MNNDQSIKEPKINGHVDRLNRYLPFSVSHDQIYEEYQTDKDGLSLETEALSYVRRALDSQASCIVLTGDAGHGKTHLCRKLIEEHLGFDVATSRKYLRENCDGGHVIKSKNINCGQLGLRIHKDFSEIAPEVAASFIESHGASTNEPLVICANEGRLRAVISSNTSGKICKELLTLFQKSFETGLASTDGALHIVNLNFQSVAAKSYSRKSESLVKRTLREWVGNGVRWKVCGNCSLADSCPIKRNRDLLGEEGDVSTRRLEKLERLCSTVERLGHVITIREMLMLVAYILTGGLTCAGVRKRLSGRQTKGWQHEYAYYNLLFQCPSSLPNERLKKSIQILADIGRLDPGKVAQRNVDERLLNIGDVFQSNQMDLQFDISTTGNKKMVVDASSGIDEVIGSPQSRADLAKESESIRIVVSALRRRAFFDDEISPGDMLTRLGFRHGVEFLSMLEEDLTPQAKVQMKNLIVSGLHGIQGLRLSGTETMLYLVDSAFGRASADAAIIARRIPTQDIMLISAENAWDSKNNDWALSRSVDWLDRRVVVRIADRDAASVELPLDLIAFECVARSASGYLSEDFYAHEMRRVRAFLGKLAERGRSNDGQISLFMNGKLQNVSLDMGVIQVSGGA